MLVWGADETRELVPFKNSFERNWQGRALTGATFGVEVAGGLKVVPTPPFKIAGRGVYYTPSIESEDDVLKFIIHEEIQENNWMDIFSDSDARSAVVTVLMSNSAMRTKLRQCVSDASSYRKRAARDTFFTAHGYHRLHSRYSANPSDQAALKAVVVDTVKSKVVHASTHDGVTNMSFWRTQPDTAILMPHLQEAGPSNPSQGVDEMATESAPLGDVHRDGGGDEEDDECFPLFVNKDALFNYHQFIGYRPKVQMESYATSIITLARLDAWIVTVIDLLDSSEGRCGKKQKLNCDMFGKSLVTATSQLIGAIGNFVQNWEPQELEVPDQCTTAEERKQKILVMEREATTVICSESPQEWYVAVKSSWFKKYVTDEMGDVHDCYIARFSMDFSSIDMLGEVVISK